MTSLVLEAVISVVAPRSGSGRVASTWLIVAAAPSGSAAPPSTVRGTRVAPSAASAGSSSPASSTTAVLPSARVSCATGVASVIVMLTPSGQARSTSAEATPGTSETSAAIREEGSRSTLSPVWSATASRTDSSGT